MNDIRDIVARDNLMQRAIETARLQGLVIGLLVGGIGGLIWREVVRFLVGWW